MEFNINRFFSLLKREFIINKSIYLSTAMFFLVYGMTNFMFMDTEHNIYENSVSYTPSFSIFFFFFFAISAQMFRGMEIKEKGLEINNFIIPASIFFFFLNLFIRIIIVLPLISIIASAAYFFIKKYILIDFLGQLGQGIDLQFVLKYQLYNILYSMPLIAVILYSTLFKNQASSMIAVGLIIGFSFLYSELDLFVGKIIAKETVVNILPYYGMDGFNIASWIFGIIVFFFFQYLSYLRISEREI